MRATFTVASCPLFPKQQPVALEQVRPLLHCTNPIFLWWYQQLLLAGRDLDLFAGLNVFIPGEQHGGVIPTATGDAARHLKHDREVVISRSLG